MSLKRVVSLLPSATEILALIGGSKMLVGRSHECDYPANLGHLPVVTASKLSFTTSSQVDTQVREAMASGDELYTLDGALLKELKPDIILTQNICSVCSIDTSSVARIVNKLSPPPLIVELNPGNLQDVLDDIIKVLLSILLDPSRSVEHLSSSPLAVSEALTCLTGRRSGRLWGWKKRQRKLSRGYNSVSAMPSIEQPAQTSRANKQTFLVPTSLSSNGRCDSLGFEITTICSTCALPLLKAH
eukprot:215282-Rhodomonas_salina.1